ncbi:MAG: HEAT repeat domain-containing protein [Chloroflexota bacterium]|nr:HEAT repeat domain-containing protein [Chloroflexota bacterium]
MRLDFQDSLRCITEQTPISTSDLYGLSGMGEKEMKRFVQAWSKVPIERRRRILKLLVELTEFSFVVDFGAAFRLCLTDEDAKVRKTAIEGLWEDKDVVLMDTLVRMLKNDPSAQVRATAATALGRFVLLGELGKLKTGFQASAEEALLEAIHSDSQALEVRRRAVESIACSGRQEVRSIIEAAYHHEHEKMRVSAVFAMGRSADPYWSETVIAELASPDSEMRYEAACACGELEVPDLVPYLAALIRDPDREVQEASIWALGHVGGNEAQRILEECYEDGDEYLCEAAEKALEYLEFMRGSSAIPSLDDNLEDEMDG